MLEKLLLYINTCKYLKWKQIYFRLYFVFQNRFKKFIRSEPSKPIYKSLDKHLSFHLSCILKSNFFHSPLSFTFLNKTHHFNNEIDWNFSLNGKLWTYNLNYFEFLLQEDVSKDVGLDLMTSYIVNKNNLMDGLEPFPTSLRIINWIKFIEKHQLVDPKISEIIQDWMLLVSHRLEFHLMGNHLLENLFSLYFSSIYFDDQALRRKIFSHLKSQLKEQILSDGAHFELSPMYHQIMLFRLLDCIQMAQKSQIDLGDEEQILRSYAKIMLSWIQQITFKNGQIPLLNDSAEKIAPSTSQLLSYGKYLGIDFDTIPLHDSGYRKFKTDSFELLIDIGQIGPSYIPGHAHADTFNFLLNYHHYPLIVDTGISTYHVSHERSIQRSTISHNTVTLDSINSSQVWSSFRVANRAQVFDILESNNQISASHDGYKKYGVTHRRSFSFFEKSIKIQDQIQGRKQGKYCQSSIHFHPDVELIWKDNFITLNNKVRITINGHSSIQKETYDYCPEFNLTKNAQKMVISFKSELSTTIIML